MIDCLKIVAFSNTFNEFDGENSSPLVLLWVTFYYYDLKIFILVRRHVNFIHSSFSFFLFSFFSDKGGILLTNVQGKHRLKSSPLDLEISSGLVTEFISLDFFTKRKKFLSSHRG